MIQKIYQVDAFADRVFSGNPAAVCPLDHWLSDTIMLQIAAENNLAETAFFVKEDNRYHIRWFTPTTEVDLCGHATLASAYVLFYYGNHQGDTIEFITVRSGPLTVTRKNDLLTLNFPSDIPQPTPLTEDLCAGLSLRPHTAYKGKTDYLLVYASEHDIRNLKPDFSLLSTIAARGIIVTARGEKTDFVSRFFGPRVGVNEDPVTGSAHTTLIPYWAGQLGKNVLTARQLSTREGYLECVYLHDRVEISGQCKLYMKGELYLDNA